ncbi:hypothetical protein ACJZ2D_011165 [Fusarium nematophilum]
MPSFLLCVLFAHAVLDPDYCNSSPISIMADRKKITYTFKGVEEWEEFNQRAIDIVKEDTGAQRWASDRALPPTSHPPPLTGAGIDKLKGLDGVIVQETVEGE